MKHPLICACAVAVVGSILATTTDSLGDGKPALTADQQAAKAAFEEDIKESLDDMKKQCGVDLAVTTDFENYDKTFWVNGFLESRRGTPATAEDRARWEKAGLPPPQQGPTCAEAIQAMTRMCKPRRGQTESATAPSFKGIACLIAGHKPRQQNERLDDHVQRNLSFTNGVLTVLIPPSPMGNIYSNVSEVVRPPTDRDLRNGVACTSSPQCKSFMCSKGLCAPCGPGAACSAGASCSKGGVCLTIQTQSNSEESREVRASSKSESKPDTRKALGQGCKTDSECRSGKCKQKTARLRTCG
jgi:hypothetical protein